MAPPAFTSPASNRLINCGPADRTLGVPRGGPPGIDMPGAWPGRGTMDGGMGIRSSRGGMPGGGPGGRRIPMRGGRPGGGPGGSVGGRPGGGPGGTRIVVVPGGPGGPGGPALGGGGRNIMWGRLIKGGGPGV